MAHQWTSLIRLSYSLAPKGNRNLPQRRNFEVTILRTQALQTTDRQVSRLRDTYRPTGKSQFVIAASSADWPNTNAA